MKWYFPAWNGDFRLEATGDAACTLIVKAPTPLEIEQLSTFLNKAKKWLPEGKNTPPDLGAEGETTVPLAIDVATAGKKLLKFIRPRDATLTAVKFEGGKLSIAEGTEGMAIESVVNGGATAAVSVKRPTISCPNCVPGSIEPAREVLLQFLTPEQHESWAQNRMMVVRGGLSGHRYILAHRHTAQARKQGFICFDFDSTTALHFHDWSVPPEEEVLASKLILEHREPWLRNEGSLFHIYQQSRCEPLFKNPFGNYLDGVEDALLVHAIGGALSGFVGES